MDRPALLIKISIPPCSSEMACTIRLDLGLLRKVTRVNQNACTRLGNNVGDQRQLLFVTRNQMKGSATAGQRFSDGFADPAARPGDENMLTVDAVK